MHSNIIYYSLLYSVFFKECGGFIGDRNILWNMKKIHCHVHDNPVCTHFNNNLWIHLNDVTC